VREMIPIPKAEEESYLPRVLPLGWIRRQWPSPAFECYGLGAQVGVRVIINVSVEEDGRKWMHVSVSRASHCPSWEEMDAVKRIFIGDDRTAYQVHPPRAEHYSYTAPEGTLGPRVVLHLWAPLEGELPLPNFLRSGLPSRSATPRRNHDLP